MESSGERWYTCTGNAKNSLRMEQRHWESEAVWGEGGEGYARCFGHLSAGLQLWPSLMGIEDGGWCAGGGEWSMGDGLGRLECTGWTRALGKGWLSERRRSPVGLCMGGVGPQCLPRPLYGVFFYAMPLVAVDSRDGPAPLSSRPVSLEGAGGGSRGLLAVPLAPTTTTDTTLPDIQRPTRSGSFSPMPQRWQAISQAPAKSAEPWFPVAAFAIPSAMPLTSDHHQLSVVAISFSGRPNSRAHSNPSDTLLFNPTSIINPSASMPRRAMSHSEVPGTRPGRGRAGASTTSRLSLVDITPSSTSSVAAASAGVRPRCHAFLCRAGTYVSISLRNPRLLSPLLADAHPFWGGVVTLAGELIMAIRDAVTTNNPQHNWRKSPMLNGCSTVPPARRVARHLLPCLASFDPS